MRIVWRKHNPMISSSGGSGHHGKYSYEIPHEYLKGWGKLSGKTISVKRNHLSNLGFFFLTAISPLACVATFSRQLYFGRSYFFTLFQSNYFDSYFFGTAISSEQLLFSQFSEQSLFRRSFRIKISKKELILQSSYFCTVSTFLEKIDLGKS